MRNPIASSACYLTAFLLASNIHNSVLCSRYDRFKSWASDLSGINKFSKNTNIPTEQTHQDSTSSSSSGFSSYFPSLSFGRKSEHGNDSISSLVNSLSSNFPSAKMTTRPGYKEVSTKNTYYYGEVDSDGERHGNGMLYDKESGCIYIGGWCNNCRNGLGISFTPNETSSKSDTAKYTVGMHRWRMGFIQEHFNAVSSVGEHFVALLRLLEVKGYTLNGLVDLLNALIDSDRIESKKDCSADGFVGVSGVSTANKPYYQEVSIGGMVDGTSASLGSYTSDKVLSNSFIIPFRVGSSQHAVVQLLSLEENYHPTAVLFEVDEYSSNSKKKLIGRKISSGHAISNYFSNDKKYYLEVGTRTSGTKLSNSVSSGKFQVLLLEKAAMNEISGRSYSVTSGSFTYKIYPTGSFTQKDGSTTRTVGTYSKDIAPFWNNEDSSITFFFIDGESCNGTPRMGKLDIAFENSSNTLDLSNVEENPTCVYKANASSKYAGILRDTISKATTSFNSAKSSQRPSGFGERHDSGEYGQHQHSQYSSSSHDSQQQQHLYR
jgi:hypothetical protein